MNISRFASGALAGLPLVAAGAEPVFTVRPYDHRHVYESGMAGYTWYWGHFKSLDNKDDALRWLFQDLHMDYIRTGFDSPAESSNDNSNPQSIDWSKFSFSSANTGNEWVYNQAKPLNPRLKTVAYAHGFPDWLRKSDGTPNYSYANFYAEYAEWLFANLVNKKAVGVPCDILDIYNEGDYQGFGKTHVANLLKNGIPLLRDWVNDPARNTTGVVMPKIMAPSCLSANESGNWLRDWEANDSSTWGNIDIVATHQYSDGFNGWNYSSVNAIRGGRPFMQSEMHCGHSSVLNNSSQLPEDWVEDQLESALSLGRLFSKSVNNGVSVYDYYMGVSPQGSATSLLYSPYNGTASRRKVYYAFKQLSSMQTRGSNVVPVSIANGVDGYDAVAYHSWGEQKTWITATCSQDTDQSILLEVRDQTGNPLPMLSVKTYETSETRNAELVATESFPAGRVQHRVQLPAHCLRTFEISWNGTNQRIAQDNWEDPAFMAGGSGWNGGWVRSGSPLPFPRSFNKNIAACLRGRGAGESSMTRTLATPLAGDGVLRFKWDVDALDDGERVTAQVFDGTWHEVWYATMLSNGSDRDTEFDNIRQQNVSLSGYGTITDIRFVIQADSSNDYFHVDDVELVATSAGTTAGLVWKGDDAANRWVADATPNWLSGATPAGYDNEASVLFDDTGSNTPSIDLVGELEPSAVTVDATKDYTLTGGGSVAGSAALEKYGSGRLTLNQPNTYTGGTRLKQGFLQPDVAGALGAGTLTVETTLGSGGRVLLGPGVTLANPVVVNESKPGVGQGLLGVNSGSATYAGPVTVNNDALNGGHIRGASSGNLLDFTGPLTKAAGATSIVVRDGFVRLSGGGNCNTLDIGAGTTSIGTHNGAPSNAVLRLGASGSPTFDLNGWNQTLAGLVRQANAPVVTNTSSTPSTLTVNPGGSAQSYDGIIAGNLALAIPAGTVELGGNCTFTGGVQLGGTLRVNGTLANSGVTAANGSWLGGSGTVSGPVVMQAGSNLSVGPAAVGTMRFSSSLSLTGANFKAEINSSTLTADIAVVSGSVSLSSGTNLLLSDVAASPVALPAGTKRAIINYTGGSLTGTFNGLPTGATVNAGPNTWSINYADTSNGLGVSGSFVTLSVVTPGSYATWASNNGIAGQPFDDDGDGDGLANGLEWILGGNPSTSDAGGRITATVTASGDLRFSFTRDFAVVGSSSLAVEWTTDLAASWPHSVMIGATSSFGANGVIVNVSGNDVVVTIPSSNAVDGKVFARLRAAPLQ